MPEETNYIRNNLNQYYRTDTAVGEKTYKQHLAYDADGNLTHAYIVGDLNCDGRFDIYDIDPFILAVTNPPAYRQQYPNCDIRNADVNGDGATNTADIDAFVALLTGGIPAAALPTQSAA